MSQEETKNTAEALACQCEACLRDGIHERDCAVHDQPAHECSCGRTEQSKGAG